MEGTFTTRQGEPWEYSVVLAIHDEKGDEITRQVLGVGALKPAEQRDVHAGGGSAHTGDTGSRDEQGRGVQEVPAGA